MNPREIDGVLVQWGDRLFYPSNRMVKPDPPPRFKDPSKHDRANEIRARIEATAVRRAPQVMVKVTGGGRGMKAITAHLRYISKNGRLEMEDELGNKEQGRGAVPAIADDWRFGGTPIQDGSDRREGFNIMLSMPRGTSPLGVQQAAREFAREELSDHKYVMVLHDHQSNPHVHLCVRAESKHGKRLNPRKADLQRWRETFAEKLREFGIDAEATRQATRGVNRNPVPLWRLKADEGGRARSPRQVDKSGAAVTSSRVHASEAWRQIAAALGSSQDPSDRGLGAAVDRFSQTTRSRAEVEPGTDQASAGLKRPSVGFNAGDRR